MYFSFAGKPTLLHAGRKLLGNGLWQFCFFTCILLLVLRHHHLHRFEFACRHYHGELQFVLFERGRRASFVRGHSQFPKHLEYGRHAAARLVIADFWLKCANEYLNAF